MADKVKPPSPDKVLKGLLKARTAIHKAIRELPDSPNVDAVKHAAGAVEGALDALEDAYQTKEKLNR